MVKSKFKILILSISAFGGSSTAIFAQDAGTQADNRDDFYSRNKYVAVEDRTQEAFDPAPMRWGSFFAQPELKAGLTSDSNLFATEQNEESDVITHLAATLGLQSNWNRNQLGAKISGRQNEYADFGSESNFDFRSQLYGRLDVSRDVSINGEVYYDDRTEARTQLANDSSNVEPIQLNVTGARAVANYQNDRTRLSAGLTVEGRDYDDGRTAAGAEFDQDFRDRTTTTALLVASYAVTPNVAVFAQVRNTDSDYDKQTPIGGELFDRDSTGYNLQGGVDFELTSLLRGRIGVGYLEEDRKDSRFEDLDGLTLDGRLQWFPSQIVTVTFNGSRAVEAQGLLEVPNAVATKFGAKADYEFRRNVVLSVSGEVGDVDFDEINRTDEISNISISAKYKLNRNAHFEAFARNLNRDADNSTGSIGQPFDKNVFGIGVTLYPY